MADCARHDISERLIMALAPDEFPQEAQEFEEHLKHCPSCRNELDALRTIDKIIRDHQDQLSNALEPCPTAKSLVDFAFGEPRSERIEDHISLCSNCAEQVSLIKALLHESLNETISAPEEATALIRKAISKEMGSKEKARSQPAGQVWHRFVQFFHVPSLAMGAAAAVICFLVIAPYKSKNLSFSPAFSNVTWSTSTSATSKETSGVTSVPAVSRKKVATIIMLPENMQLSEKEIDKIYSGIGLAARLGGHYQFLPPDQIKQLLKERSGLDGESVSRVMSEATDANYVLVFEIVQSKSGFGLKGKLFRKGEKEESVSIFQTGLSLSAIPSKMTGMGAELLLDAESQG